MLPRRHGAEVWRLAEVAGRLAEADVVIAAVQTPDRLIGADHCRRAIRVRAGRPLVIVDVSVPRAVDPAAAGIEGVLLSAIDDLGDVVRRSVARRASEVPRVEAIVRFEARRAYARFDARRRRAG